MAKNKKQSEDDFDDSIDHEATALKYLEDNYTFPSSAAEARLASTPELINEIKRETGAVVYGTHVISIMQELNATSVKPTGVTYWLLLNK